MSRDNKAAKQEQVHQSAGAGCQHCATRGRHLLAPCSHNHQEQSQSHAGTCTWTTMSTSLTVPRTSQLLPGVAILQKEEPLWNHLEPWARKLDPFTWPPLQMFVKHFCKRNTAKIAAAGESLWMTSILGLADKHSKQTQNTRWVQKQESIKATSFSSSVS